MSAKYGPTHLDQLIELAARRPEGLASRHVVLKHFRMKYGERAIRVALQGFPAELRARVTMLV